MYDYSDKDQVYDYSDTDQVYDYSDKDQVYDYSDTDPSTKTKFSCALKAKIGRSSWCSS